MFDVSCPLETKEYGARMEAEIIRQLRTRFATVQAQQEELTRLVNEFGNTDTSEIKFTVSNILCLAKMLYEAGNKRVIRNMQTRMDELEDALEPEDALGGDPNRKRDYLQKLTILRKCLTNFKPAIFKSIQMHFAEMYSISPEWIACLPKTVGQQIGAKAIIHRASNDENPITFYVKSHSEFCSKTHSQYLAITSDGTGVVDFKELFMYKTLEHVGYGSETYFIVDRDVSGSRVDEGVLIATRDLSCTAQPDVEAKLFNTFAEVGDELRSTPIDAIDENTKRDIVAIDMLSRAFLLEDVMINQGNFGRESSTNLSSQISSHNWKIIDFIPPVLMLARGDDYSYSRHYPGGVSIFHSFRVGNASHTYNREGLEVIHRMLSEEHARRLWLPVVERLSTGTERYLPIRQALNAAFENIREFMIKNTEILHIKPDRLARRLDDLNAYKEKILQNFMELEHGIREYCSIAPHQPTLVQEQPNLNIATGVAQTQFGHIGVLAQDNPKSDEKTATADPTI